MVTIIKVIICDDNEKARYILKEYLKRINLNELELIAEAENGYELIEICKTEKPDIILLDIDMPFINGIETAKKIMKFLSDISFIFITAYPSFSLEAFEVHAVDYILKPVSIERLKKALKYIINKSLPKNEDDKENISFKSNHDYYTVKKEDILFAERTGRKTLIHTQSQNFEVYESLYKLQKKLSSEQFVRTHNSYLINKKPILKIGKYSGGSHEVHFKNCEKIAYISRRRMPNIDNL